jgi:hypothetical protein
MIALQFHVRPRGRDPRWVVTVGQALLDAVDAARDATQAGYEVQVWIKDRSAPTRVF